MNLTFKVVEGGFVQNGFRYVLRANPTDGSQNQGNIIIFSATAIPAYTEEATVVINVPLTATAV